ncbi:MAG: hypothetical protein LBB10_00065 [Bifidobacteriaceae bacterium]|jgi:hypothetical protein|nr:hypothetical protein [Bifidobacteriaceae bacterium]
MKKSIAFFLSFLISVICVGFLTGCDNQNNNDLSINQNPIITKVVPMQIASSASGEASILAKVIENSEKYKFSQVEDSQILKEQVQDGTYNFALLKTLDAANLYKTSEKRIKIIASITKDCDWVLVVNVNYLDLNMNNVAEFMQDISASVDWIYSNQTDAISVSEKDKLSTKSQLQPLIKKKSFKYLDGDKMKTQLNKFFKKNESLVSAPKSDIYFIRT